MNIESIIWLMSWVGGSWLTQVQPPTFVAMTLKSVNTNLESSWTYKRSLDLCQKFSQKRFLDVQSIFTLPKND